jgi:hypothetical protein
LVAERYGTEHHELVVRPGRTDRPANARPALRRAVRRLVSRPKLLRVPAHPPACDRGPQWRRRGRGLRRL